MKTGQNFGLMYLMLLVCQVLICNYFTFTPYVMLTLLPAMTLCIPLTVSTVGSMFIALISGLAVDWMAEGIIGLNAASLIPVALLRKTVLRLFFGEDIIIRKDSFSVRKYGNAKVGAAILLPLVIFISIYILLDGAGTRPAWFCLTKGFSSLLCSYLLSLLVVNILTPDDRK